MTDPDDDETSWWKELTLPQVILIVGILFLLFGGVKCSFDVKTTSPPQQEPKP